MNSFLTQTEKKGRQGRKISRRSAPMNADRANYFFRNDTRLLNPRLSALICGQLFLGALGIFYSK